MSTDEVIQPEKKKRGRKPKSEKVIVNKDNNETVLLHLKIFNNQIKSENFETNFCEYKPELNIPNPYCEDDIFRNKPFEFQDINDPEDKKSKVKTILKDFTNNKDWNSNTSYHCYWCCHKCDNITLGIPIKMKDGLFYVNGCFCSFECMTAHNFDSVDNIHNVWETYNLINLMAKKFEYKNIIYPAPPRKCLQMFGGFMDINEFRNYNNTSKIININTYPVVTVVDQVEEINDFYHKQQNKDSDFFYFDKERIERFEKKIKEQRKEDIKLNYDNTLNKSMNVVVN